MAPTPEDRRCFRVDLEYSLCRPEGWKSPTNQVKSWFFETPAARAGEADWTELLHRIFYDANVQLRRRAPGSQPSISGPIDPRVAGI